MEDRKIVVINKFAAIESRINTMLEILKIINQAGELTGEKFEQVHKLLLKQQSVEEKSE
jgi:hypothetical protein